MLLVGRVTRLAAYIEGEPKVYDATIMFGSETDTDDCTGRPTVTAPLPEAGAVEAAIPSLTGTVEQVPPAYSAKQVGGVRAYDAARRGAPLELRSVRVDVHGWTLRGWRSPSALEVTVTCAGGTYIRALARDLGRLARSAAHLSSLRRTRSGPFDVGDAVAPAQLTAHTPLRSPLAGLGGLTHFTLTADERASVTRGQAIRRPVGTGTGDSATRAALLDERGVVVAIAERNGEHWAPKVVLADG